MRIENDQVIKCIQAKLNVNSIVSVVCVYKYLELKS